MPCLLLVAAMFDGLPERNASVARWAWDRLGEKVGNGECWTLADRALLQAGAQRPGRGGLGLYEFGERVEPGRLLPGDVVQFEGAKFKGGLDYGHHTALVVRVRGTRLAILHQNDGGDKRVRMTFFDLADRKAGEVSFFRPMPFRSDD